MVERFYMLLMRDPSNARWFVSWNLEEEDDEAFWLYFIASFIVFCTGLVVWTLCKDCNRLHLLVWLYFVLVWLYWYGHFKYIVLFHLKYLSWNSSVSLYCENVRNRKLMSWTYLLVEAKAQNVNSMQKGWGPKKKSTFKRPRPKKKWTVKFCVLETKKAELLGLAHVASVNWQEKHI